MPFLNNYYQPDKCRARAGNKCAHQLINRLMKLGQGWGCRCSRERKDHHKPAILPSPQSHCLHGWKLCVQQWIGRVSPFVTLISVWIWTTKRIIAKRDKKLLRKYYKVLCQPPLDYSWGIIKKKKMPPCIFFIHSSLCKIVFFILVTGVIYFHCRKSKNMEKHREENKKHP